MAVVAGAGAAVARSRRRVIDSFRELGAFSAESAIPFHPVRGIDGRMFERLQRRNIILPAEGRRFYIDANALAASDKMRSQIKTVALGGVGATLLAVLAATLLV